MHTDEEICYSLSVMGALWTRGDGGARIGADGVPIEGTPFGFTFGEPSDCAATTEGDGLEVGGCGSFQPIFSTLCRGELSSTSIFS